MMLQVDLLFVYVLCSFIFVVIDDYFIVLVWVGESMVVLMWWECLIVLVVQFDVVDILCYVYCMLLCWLVVVFMLFVYDLFDYIVYMGEFKCCYVECVLVVNCDQVFVNLDVFLKFVFDLDGGCYLSLLKFMVELCVICQGDEDESFDEGMQGDMEVLDVIDVEVVSEGFDVVQILIVYVFKGLEVLFVVLFDSYYSDVCVDMVGILIDWLFGVQVFVYFFVFGKMFECGFVCEFFFK